MSTDAGGGQVASAGENAGESSRNFMILIYALQFFFGAWFVAHGLNQWLDFFPRPKGSSPIARDLIMAMNAAGLFPMIKVLEVITGALLLANRFVPLAIVGAFPVAVSIAHLNLVSNPDPMSKVVGVVIMVIICLLALGHLDKFLPMLAFNSGDPSDRGLRQFFNKK